MEDVPLAGIGAEHLLGPLMSAAALLMPIVPVVGLRGGATLYWCQ
jgi:hypothetical protein